MAGNDYAIAYHSAIGQSAWIDLLRLLKEEAVSDIRGTPRLKTRAGRGYWYDQYRIASKVVDRYIGEDTEELRERIAQHEAFRAQAKRRNTERSRLMRILRAEGYLTVDVGTGQILLAMARSGTFRLGGTLVGTQAFRMYEGVLGVQIRSDLSAQTDDIDIASFERLSIALQDQAEPGLEDVFDDLDFAPLPSVDRGQVWRWQQSDRQTLIEFLTPSFREDEGIVPLPALGVSAQSLHFLNYLIAEPIQAPALYRNGILVQIPRPERYAIHKLIVAEQRRDGSASQKARKDRIQADFLIRVLAEERPEDLADAYSVAMEKGPAWQSAIGASLGKLGGSREILAALTGER